MVEEAYRDAKDELYELAHSETADQARVLYGCLLAYCDKLYEEVVNKIKEGCK